MDPLIEAIARHPGDPHGYAVYGDWLVEHGDPVGEMVVLDHTRRAQPERAHELSPRLMELRRKYEREQFGGLTERDENLYVHWEYGFIASIEVDTRRGREFLEALAASTAARLLRTLDLTVRMADRRSSWIDPDPTTDPIPHLVEHGLPRTVTDLRLSLELADGGRIVPDDVSEIWARLPQLTRLVILRPHRLGALDLPVLQSLDAEYFEESQLVELAGAKLPSLEFLGLEKANWHALPALDSLDLPRLEEVSTTIFALGDPTKDFAALTRSRLIQRARRLNLSNAIQRGVGDALVENARALVNEQVIVSAAHLELTQLRALGAILGERLVIR